jgi:ribosomal protein L37AE/L43A
MTSNVITVDERFACEVCKKKKSLDKFTEDEYICDKCLFDIKEEEN